MICDGLLHFIFPLFTPWKCTEARYNAKRMCDKQCFCVCSERFNKQVFANMDATPPPLPPYFKHNPCFCFELVSCCLRR